MTQTKIQPQTDSPAEELTRSLERFFANGQDPAELGEVFRRYIAEREPETVSTGPVPVQVEELLLDARLKLALALKRVQRAGMLGGEHIAFLIDSVDDTLERFGCEPVAKAGGVS